MKNQNWKDSGLWQRLLELGKQPSRPSPFLIGSAALPPSVVRDSDRSVDPFKVNPSPPSFPFLLPLVPGKKPDSLRHKGKEEGARIGRKCFGDKYSLVPENFLKGSKRTFHLLFLFPSLLHQGWGEEGEKCSEKVDRRGPIEICIRETPPRAGT